MNLGDFDYYFIEKEFYYINVNKKKNVCNIIGWQWQVVIWRQEAVVVLQIRMKLWTQYFHSKT